MFPTEFRMDSSPINARPVTHSRFDLTFEDDDEPAFFTGKPKMLKFTMESDEELNGRPVGGNDAFRMTTTHNVPYRLSINPLSPGVLTPNTHMGSASHLWDSGLGSPTPGSRPAMGATPLSSERFGAASRGGSMSPIPTLNYDSDDMMEGGVDVPDTPPHRHMKALHLHDNPQTPKSLLQRSQRRWGRASGGKSRSSEKSEGKPKDEELNSSRGKLLDPSRPQTNVNPFTSYMSDKIELGKTGVKRTRAEVSSTDDDSSIEDCDTVEVPCKRLALREINTSRYMEEFHQISKIGDGEFGSVYDCVNRLDGCHYAIKKSKIPVAESVFERNAMNEVYAHAVLGKHLHVVRYFSAWSEDGHMYIQNEFCNGGSLATVISAQHRASDREVSACEGVTGGGLPETELKQILLHTARGLKYIHSMGLAHLDIKPGNIFLHRESYPAPIEDSEEDSQSGDIATQHQVIYKIGDLGHVTSVRSPLVEEGDCRYLPVEVLQESYSDLAKADIFSLALTVYEAATLTELPKNGVEWHEIRERGLPTVPHLSPELNSLLKSMASYNPKDRPSSSALVHHPLVVPAHLRSRAQLCKELKVERLKNEMLTRELVEVKQTISEQTTVGMTMVSKGTLARNTRLLGRKCARSASLTAF